MLQKFRVHIENNFPFLKDKKLLIAISGGVDSVVLTHLLHQLNYTINLAHCNFKLREKESDLDEFFIENLGKNLAIDTYITSFDTKEFAIKNKLSTQVAARELRYNWFKELAKEHQLDYILTAHHADDNLETFLINLTRGTGLDGFTGIPSINNNIIRPLLIFSRNQILHFAEENGISWREDASNAETKYLRNKIRYQIVPKLKEVNSNVLENFNKTISFLQETQQIVSDRILDVSKKIISTAILNNLKITKIHIDSVLKLSNSKAYLYQLLKAYNFTEWNDVVNLLTAKSGKQVFSKSHRLIKDRKHLLLTTIKSSEEKTIFYIDKNKTKITQPITLIFEDNPENIFEDNQTIYIDKELVNSPLIVRKWEKGDYFYPTKDGSKKKLSTYFKDKKMSILEKENIWLLCTAKNELIWIINNRLDSRFVVTKNSKNILKITTKN